MLHDNDNAPLQQWPYQWRHTSGAGANALTEDAISRLDFLRLLDKWNLVGAGQWTFHELDAKGLALT